jgi:hypothetical protein
MKFGIFEHMDDGGIPVGQHFENRLSLIEAYDRYGGQKTELTRSVARSGNTRNLRDRSRRDDGDQRSQSTGL